MAFIGIVFHPKRDSASHTADELIRWLLDRGHNPIVLNDDRSEAKMDLVVSLGGDGTMLRAIDRIMPSRIPVLGVNFGSLGYLTEIDPEGLFSSLERFFAGDYLIEERMALAVKVASTLSYAGGESGGRSHVALNEVVVEKLHSGHVIRVDAFIGSAEFLTYEADGVIVSTPTGSTAYSFSAHGPVVSPLLRSLVVTPISPHMLFDRSLVLDPSEKVSLRLAEGPSAAVMVDGVHVMTINPGDTVDCEANPIPAHLVTFAKRDFHQILKRKFGLASKKMNE